MQINNLIISIILGLWFSHATAVEMVLTVVRKGASDKVVSDLTGINCGMDCTESYNVGTTVLLTATPGIGRAFSSWVGCSKVVKEECTVDMDASKKVQAIFTNVVTSEQKKLHVELGKKRTEEVVTYNNKIISDRVAAIKREQEERKAKAVALEQARLEKLKKLAIQPTTVVHEVKIVHEVEVIHEVEVVHDVEVVKDKITPCSSPCDVLVKPKPTDDTLTLPGSAAPGFGFISR